jgi:hypothetical protein
VASPSGYKNITIANIAKSANSPFANSDVIVLSFIPSSGGSALTVEESDGSPTDSAITKIKFPNGTLSISSHEATYTPTAAAITIQEEDGSPTGSLTTLKVPNNSLVDNGGGSFSLRQAPQGFIGCRAYNSAAQSIANNSAVAATFDSEEYDTDGFHDTGSNTSRFTVPAGLGGKYLVNFKGYWDSLVSPSGGSSDAIIWFAKKNGTTEIRGRSRIDQTFPTGSASSVVMDLTAVIDLAAGDYIEFIVFQNHGSSANLGDNTVYQTTGEIVKLDSGRVGQGIGAVAYNSAAQAIPTATTTALTMDSEESDTDGFHSTGSNTARMTIPTGLGGRYIVTAGTYFAGNATGQRILALRKNGTTDIRGSLSRIPTSHATNGSGMNVSRVVDLVAGDYVEAVVYQDSGGNLDAGFASTNTAQSYIGIARLDSGSAAYTGALWGSGTAFPSGPVSGQRYTRTDIYGGMDFQYDGTRWRSIQVFQSAIIQENLLSWTIDAQRWRFPLFQPTYSVWLIEMRGDTVTATTNDGSHYWTVKLAKGSDNTTIVSFTTAADTVNAEANHLVAIGAVSTEKHLYVQGDRTSTPGPLYPFIVVLYQIIAT